MKTKCEGGDSQVKGYRKLGRPTAHRKAMLRNQVTDLLREGRITTTDDESQGNEKNGGEDDHAGKAR